MSGMKIGTVWGIPIRLHYSWFLVFGLLTWSLSREYYVFALPGQNISIYLILGLVTSLLFFTSVLAHELGHSWLALHEGIPVKVITLFIFGGVAQIEREPHSPGAEFRIAIAGPVVSLLVAIFFGLVFLAGRQVAFLAAPNAYLLRINFFLAVFNLIPGFPLDGGRVLRAAVWAYKKDQASHPGGNYQWAGDCLYVYRAGNYQSVLSQVANGMWMFFIGWFLQNASLQAFQQVSLEYTLKGSTVDQAMNRHMVRLPGLTPLSYVLDEQMLTQTEPVIYVTEYGEVSGLLTARELTSIPRPHWRFTTINQIMLPISRLRKITPDMDLFSAVRDMDEAKLATLPVMDGDQVIGSLSRDNVISFLRGHPQVGK